jgi:DNA-binding NarL/FixJ family response regulator
MYPLQAYAANSTHIVIADGRPRVRFALRTLLGRQAGLDIVGEAQDAEDLLAQIEGNCPDVVLLDWRLEGLETADLLAALHWRCPGLYVIVLSGRPEARRMALDAGADVFVSKIDPPDRLLAAIRSVQRVDAALNVLAASLQG